MSIFVEWRVRENLRAVHTIEAVDHFDSGTYSWQRPGVWRERSLHGLIYINLLAAPSFTWEVAGLMTSGPRGCRIYLFFFSKFSVLKENITLVDKAKVARCFKRGI